MQTRKEEGFTHRVVPLSLWVIVRLWIIKRLIKESSYLSEAAEKPVAVAGDFRGIREEKDLNGVYVEAAKVYVKTIRLAH